MVSEDRKEMPRQPRVFVDGAMYHVYCRVGRGERVFESKGEVEELLSILTDVKQRDGFAVLAWCVMANHYHLVLRSGRAPLWRTMRLVQGRYSKSFNRRNRVYGALWQGRYKAKLIGGERHVQHAGDHPAGKRDVPLWSILLLLGLAAFVGEGMLVM